MERKLILDTDGGVDDAQALLMLIAASRTPDLIITVFGNVDLTAATRNILSVLAVAGKPRVPVHMGADRPLAQPAIDATNIHGADGLGGAPRPAKIPDPAGRDGVGVLTATLQEAAEKGEKVDLLMIGPLTNLALAIRQAPDCIAGIGQLTIMGGTMFGRGNITPAAEFNIFSDPEAAAIVFGANIEIIMVPWETCVTQKIDGPDVDQFFAALPDGPYQVFSHALAHHARSVIKGFGGGDHMRFVDPLAAAVVIDRTIATRSQQACVEVALSPGVTRAMTVIDPTGRLGTPNVSLVEEADLDRVIALYQASITYNTPLTVVP